MSHISRRHFIQTTGAALATGTLLSQTARADVNSQLRVAVIGLKGRGRSHLQGLTENVVAVCDCDQEILGQRAQQFEQEHGRKVERIIDYRRLLDRDDIDAVAIATPNHTHALISIEAAQAGKDVYCEKPVSHDVWEGRQIANAARRYNRIIQCGTQARSSNCLQQAVRYVRSGKLGAIKYAIGTCYKPRKSIGKLDQPLRIPSQLDYNLWCGPAAMVDLYRPQLHYDWHWDSNTGNGDMGNQGIHQMDIARWFLGENQLSPQVISFGGRLGYEDAGNTPNTLVTLHNYAAAPLLFETRGLPRSKEAQSDWANQMDTFRGSRVGVIVQCEHGHVFAPSNYSTAIAYSNEGEVIERWEGAGDHYQNFLMAVESRKPKDLNAEILEGHLSSALCHTGNISYQLGDKHSASEVKAVAEKHELLAVSVDRMLQHLKSNGVDVDQPVVTTGPWLTMDPATEQFTDSTKASALLRRQCRQGFVVPQIV